MKKILLLAVFAGFVAPAAFAGSAGGSDSCGLGWEITSKKSFLATTTRATTNAFIPPTFGMTTGTIGCDQHSLAKNEIPGAEFVASNYDNLVIEMAAGNGENLQALARTLGCSDAAAAELGSITKAGFEGLVGNGGSVELFKNVKNSSVALGCSI